MQHTRSSRSEGGGMDGVWRKYDDPISSSTTPGVPGDDSDLRTVMCLQLPSQTKEDDLKEFFTFAGQVSGVKIVMDSRHRPKGCAYVEFASIHSIPGAVALSGRQLHGTPILVRESAAHKNRMLAENAEAKRKAAAVMAAVPGGGTKLFIGSLNFSVTEDMVRQLFQPFGDILEVVLIKEPQSGVSKGYGFVRFVKLEEAELAIKVLDGFMLTGRALVVRFADNTREAARNPQTLQQQIKQQQQQQQLPHILQQQLSQLSNLPQSQQEQVLEQQQQQLMMMINQQKQIEGPNPIGSIGGMPNFSSPPPGAGNSGSLSSRGSGTFGGEGGGTAEPSEGSGSQCLLIENLFDPAGNYDAEYDIGLCDEVVAECRRQGCSKISHIAVDRITQLGHIYLKCGSFSDAQTAYRALNGRCFDGRKINLSFVEPRVYYDLFPSAARQ